MKRKDEENEECEKNDGTGDSYGHGMGDERERVC